MEPSLSLRSGGKGPGSKELVVLAAFARKTRKKKTKGAGGDARELDADH